MNFFGLLAKILYIGHSLVGPDLPAAVETGLRAMNQPATVAAQLINGAPLKFNWEHSAGAEGVDGRAELQKGETTVLILTEAIPLAEHVKWNETAAQVAQFAEQARAMNGDVRVFLYETWHSRNSGPGTDVPGDPNAALPWRERLSADLPLWEQVVRDANARLGGEVVQLLPAGQAMVLLADQVAAGKVPGVPSMDAFFADDIHLSPKGEYFVALVHLATITGKSPQGLPAKLTRTWKSRDAIISDDLAAALQSIAEQAVRAYAPAKIQAMAPTPTSETATVAPPSPAPATEPPAFTPITNPNLALGLNGVADWSVQQPFLNVLKTAREWTGHLPGQFGGWDHARLAALGALDDNGWPKFIPPELTGLSLLFFTDLPETAWGVAGRYIVTYDGKGEISLSGRAENITTGPGRIEFDFTPGTGTVSLNLSATDPTDPVRNIVVVREDRAALLASGAMFNPDWLARIRGVKTIRLMDWMKTNDSPLAHLADRPKPGDYTWSRIGVPIEVMVALANELHANPWFTLPHLADDDLIRFYATAALDGLAPDLTAHVEYSNEVWNWQFAQATWAEDQARARWGGEGGWVQFYALRAAQMADIWADVFGADAPSRLVRIISTQTGWTGLEQDILTAPKVLAEGLPAPATHFDAYAVTGYFSGMIGADPKADTLRGWLADSALAAQKSATDQGLMGDAATAYVQTHRFDAALEKAAQEIETGALTGDAADTLAALTTQILPYHADIAHKHGLRLMMYEGGTHVVGLGANVDDTDLTDFFTTLNYSPQMAHLYEKLRIAWAGLTPEPFNAFVDVASPSKWGSWGALRHLGDENPRWQALAKSCASC